MDSPVLQRPTLVLNRNWQAVAVATAARALVKVFAESALIVDPADYRQYAWDDWSRLRPEADEPLVRTSTDSIRVPEVITLTTYDRVPTQTVTFSRRNIFKRDRFTCQYCGRQPGQSELTIDHVQPRAQGGSSSWANCVLACIECNSRKADRTPDQAGMTLRKEPVRPSWRPLYAADGVRIDSWQKFVTESFWSVELES